MGETRAAAARLKKREAETVPSLHELVDMRQKEINPLSYNCDFNRLTQLFQRPLQIKYHAKKEAATTEEQKAREGNPENAQDQAMPQ